MNIPSMLDKEKLGNSNILDWYQKKDYVLEGPLPKEHRPTPKAVHDAWVEHGDDSIEVPCLMIATMIAYLQWDLEHHDAFDIIEHLKEMFCLQVRTKIFETFISLHGCKIEETMIVRTHVLNIKSYMDQMERLFSPYPQDWAINFILNPLPKSYDTFIMNYIMNGWDMPISKLHSMLKTVEKNVPKKSPQVIMIHEEWIKNKKKGKNFKDKPQVGNGKWKKAPQSTVLRNKEKVAKDNTCFECGVVGHLKRNCPTYFVGLKAKKVREITSGISIFMIEV
uniref:CCHC-type domain-containing protein n=1 Tax=Lactuca sativa TaxID=4236 RepID=A0A9R1VVE1_LACSA|nr:hypothetical protein LSAT_V11C400204130 [Lactuca sativa]